MTETVWSQLGKCLGGAFALQTDAFQQIATLPDGLFASLLVVLFAGLSLSVGQGIILFINQVKPIRFIFSLLLNAVLYVFAFLFLVFSTWLICLLPWSVNVPFWTLVKVLGLAYAPLLFSFLGALPYAGVPILSLLSGWRLLALVVGFSAVAGVTGAASFTYVVIGWAMLQLLESTIGQPIAKLGKGIADRVAGVDLVDDSRELQERVQQGIDRITSSQNRLSSSSPQRSLSEVRQFVQAAGRSAPEAAQTVAQAVTLQSASSPAIVTSRVNSGDALVQLDHKVRNIPQLIKWLFGLLGMIVLFIVIMLLLHPIKESVFGWYSHLPNLFRFTFDLVWIGVVAIVFAGILAPLETLGWWAGWYGDELNTASAPTTTTHSLANQQPEVSRYVIYLDGIGQSGEEYTPDVEEFLTALRPALPKDMVLVQGLMMYSVLNKPLDEDRPLAFIWRLADQMRWSNPAALLGLMLNLRNVFIVGVSADKRYGPIYNQGIAQVLYNGLIDRGYEPGSGIPLTLIGYSGGGEMSVAAAPYLKRAIGAPIEIISLGGVMSANNNFLKLEHLYHIVGDKDSVERIGPVMFPGRWKLFPLSYWNRAKRRGKITILSAGPVGHQVPGGYMDPKATLPDGRTNLQQTIELILQILRGEVLITEQSMPRKLSNFMLYQQLPFMQPEYYPLNQPIDREYYQPIADWIGRLILPTPEERQQMKGVWFEVHHTPDTYQSLIGKQMKLRWVNDPKLKQLVAAVRRDVHFSADAEYSSKYGGLIHPDRLNHWQQVGPLESLAGSHPNDDLIVMLNHPVVVESDSLYIRSQPVQITGRYYGVVKFVAPVFPNNADHSTTPEQFRVVHFNRASRQFDGLEEQIILPAVALAEAYGSFPSTTANLEKSPLNEMGWYIYGAKNADGMFVVQSLAPRALLTLRPDRVIVGNKPAYQYIRKECWADAVAQKGRISSVLCVGRSTVETSQEAIDEWQAGDRALLIHTYGGIGGNKKEPAAATPIFFGHFAYGLAQVVRDPLTEELRFDLRYHQVYTHNTDGLVAGVLHWSRYMGDRQLGWAGSRPTCDILIKLDCFTGDYDFEGERRSPLETMLTHLQVMTARYRIGDGTGGTYVGPANNCSQDSNQALFASLRQMEQAVRANRDWLTLWATQNPDQAQRFKQLMQLGKALSKELQPLGGPRSDWEQNEYNLGSTLEDNPLQNLWTGLGSWRTMLPRLASDTIVRIFLRYGASVWVLRTNQIGGYDPDIEPIAPITL